MNGGRKGFPVLRTSLLHTEQPSSCHGHAPSPMTSVVLPLAGRAQHRAVRENIGLCKESSQTRARYSNSDPLLTSCVTLDDLTLLCFCFYCRQGDSKRTYFVDFCDNKMG